MKSFHLIRANRSTTVLELSLWDMIRLLFGREIMIIEKDESIVLRHAIAYDMFNMTTREHDA